MALRTILQNAELFSLTRRSTLACNFAPYRTSIANVHRNSIVTNARPEFDGPTPSKRKPSTQKPSKTGPKTGAADKSKTPGDGPQRLAKVP